MPALPGSPALLGSPVLPNSGLLFSFLLRLREGLQLGLPKLALCSDVPQRHIPLDNLSFCVDIGEIDFSDAVLHLGEDDIYLFGSSGDGGVGSGYDEICVVDDGLAIGEVALIEKMYLGDILVDELGRGGRISHGLFGLVAFLAGKGVDDRAQLKNNPILQLQHILYDNVLHLLPLHANLTHLRV